MSQVERQNAASQHRNRLIADTLNTMTEADLPADPRDWWDWWQQYVDEHPGERQAAMASGLGFDELFVHTPPSSLVEGTLVWTQLGRRPIEQIQVGDMILTAHPVNQQPVYKPVLATVQRETPTVRLGLWGESIQCGLGQFVWHVDKGWWLARDLKTESQLDALFEPISVTEDVAHGSGALTIQLVVAGRE